jgi:multiple antibiotic resistance protein
MLELLQAIPFAFGALFPVVNPIGSAIIFLSLTNGSSRRELNSLAVKISFYITIMLVTVLFFGSWLLRIFGISIPIVLIGGGLVLAYIGWQLLNKPAVPDEKLVATTNLDKDVDSMAFYPLSMPVTAGPGCIAVAIALGAHSYTHDLQTTTLIMIGNALGIIMVGLTVLFCYWYAFAITSKLGSKGTQVIIRLAAFINLCIGLQLMWHGIQLLFPGYTSA